MSNILVIGGSGFLSGTVASRALANGHSVWTVTRGQKPGIPGTHRLIADRKDPPAFAEAIRGAKTEWDLVIDCIAYDPADIRQDLGVLAAVANHLIFVSTDFVYDPAHRRFPQNEDSDFYLSEGYGGLKRRCELELVSANAGAMRWSILRPSHIYGPGSLPGCLPLHGRDPKLIERLRAGEPLKLVGGGHFLQHPVFAGDLAHAMLSMAGNAATFGRIFCIAGPDILESRTYYRIIADLLRVQLVIESVDTDLHLKENPGAAPFMCHRLYDLQRLRDTGIAMPVTPIERGLEQHIASLS